MFICPNCGNKHDVCTSASCPCGYEVISQDGLIIWHSFASDINYGAEGFGVLNAHEDKYFWFRARTALLIWCLKKYFPGFCSILDIGCGTGFVLSKISEEFSKAKLYGSDIFIEALKIAQGKLSPASVLMQMDARKIPYQDEFDVIIACDVLEHIQEDELVLENFARALRPGGGIILTVPQHPWLWSKADDEAQHVRRYTASELPEKVGKAGFKILLNTSFVSLLLPALLLSRLRTKGGNNPQSDEFEISPGLNKVLGKIMDIERWLIIHGLRFPMGGSRLVVAQKM